jgi:hypothetical protein
MHYQLNFFMEQENYGISNDSIYSPYDSLYRTDRNTGLCRPHKQRNIKTGRNLAQRPGPAAG